MLLVQLALTYLMIYIWFGRALSQNYNQSDEVCCYLQHCCLSWKEKGAGIGHCSDKDILLLQAAQIKHNISRFSGFVWHDNEVNSITVC